MYTARVQQLLAHVSDDMATFKPISLPDDMLKGYWLDLLDVYGHQGILPPSCLEDVDPGLPHLIPGYASLIQLLSEDSHASTTAVAGLIPKFWDGSLSAAQDLVVIDRVLGKLDEVSTSPLTHVNSIFGFLRIAAARVPYWEHIPFAASPSLHNFYDSTIWRSSSTYVTVVRQIRANIFKLRKAIACSMVSQGTEATYALASHGLAFLYHFYLAGLISQHSHHRLPQTAPAQKLHDELWRLIVGMATEHI